MKRFFALLILTLTLLSFTAITSFASEIPNFHHDRDELNKYVTAWGLSLDEYDVANSSFYTIINHSNNNSCLTFYYAGKDFKIASSGHLYNSDSTKFRNIAIWFNPDGTKLNINSQYFDAHLLDMLCNDERKTYISMSKYDFDKHLIDPKSSNFDTNYLNNSEVYVSLRKNISDVVPQNAFTDLLLRLKPLVLPVFIAIIGFLSFRKAWSFISSAVKGA